MSQVVNCPECQSKVRIADELLGRKVKCPRCLHAFLAESEGAARPAVPAGRSAAQPRGESTAGRDDEDSGEPDDAPRSRRSRRGRSDRTAWRTVRNGLSLYLAGFFLVLGALVLVILGVIISTILVASDPNLQAGRGNPPGQPGGAALAGGILILVVFGVAGLALLGAVGTWIASQVFILGAPDRRGARALAYATSGLFAVNMLLSCVGGIMGVVAQAHAQAQPPVFVPPPAPVRPGVPGAPPFAPAPVVRPAGAVPPSLSLGQIGLSLASTVISFGWQFCFLFFLRAAAQGVGAEDVGDNVKWLIVFLASMLFLGFLSVVAIVALAGFGAGAMNPQQPGGAAQALMGIGFAVIGGACLFSVLQLVYLIWQIVAVFQVRAAIADYVE